MPNDGQPPATLRVDACENCGKQRALVIAEGNRVRIEARAVSGDRVEKLWVDSFAGPVETSSPSVTSSRVSGRGAP